MPIGQLLPALHSAVVLLSCANTDVTCSTLPARYRRSGPDAREFEEAPTAPSVSERTKPPSRKRARRTKRTR